ncbi:hypothetical protein IF2G_01037 [Cordyceps javanica]|nr:hypothetical protein IF2G_01037 [Cordyceps javanica]
MQVGDESRRTRGLIVGDFDKNYSGRCSETGQAIDYGGIRLLAITAAIAVTRCLCVLWPCGRLKALEDQLPALL